MCRGAYLREAYTWSNTSVKEKVGLSAGCLFAGGLVGREKCGICEQPEFENREKPSKMSVTHYL